MLTDDQKADLTSERIQGFVYATGKPLDIPLISHIHENLYMGGCPKQEKHTQHFTGIIDLYGKQLYPFLAGTRVVIWPLLDSDEAYEQPIKEELAVLRATALHLLERGPTLIHCQAGLNRSGLLTALVLCFYADMHPKEAIDKLREIRCDQVLCNEKFELLVRTIGGR